MSFNPYNTYSILSLNENKKNNDMFVILEQLEKLKTFTNAKDVSNYLEKELNINGNTGYIGKNILVEIFKTNTIYTVSVSCSNKNFIYTYNKEGVKND